jgi:hypothetical protein
LGTPPESAGDLDIKRPPAPPILRTAKTVGTGLLAAVALLITGTEASAAPIGSPCSAAALACVDLSSQQAWLLQAGIVTYGPVPVATGKASAPTAPGTFYVTWKDLHHRSSEFHNAPMPYMSTPGCPARPMPWIGRVCPTRWTGSAGATVRVHPVRIRVRCYVELP